MALRVGAKQMNKRRDDDEQAKPECQEVACGRVEILKHLAPAAAQELPTERDVE